MQRFYHRLQGHTIAVGDRRRTRWEPRAAGLRASLATSSRGAACILVAVETISGTDDTVLEGGDGDVDSSDTLRRGDRLDRYEVLGILGAGGMGVVYRASDPNLRREVAIKVLRTAAAVGSDACQQLCTRLLREARAMALLSHPNLVPIYDVGTFGGRVYLVMEYVAGQTLAEWIDEATHSWRECLDMFMKAGRGLAEAHEVGIVHRDFKPDNVLVSKKGRVQVADFGLAQPVGRTEAPAVIDGRIAAAPSASSSLTSTGAIVGTPAFMSPEQFKGDQVDERSDQFSYAVALYQALYGRRPFAGRTIAEIGNAVLAGEVLDPPASTDVPPPLAGTIRRALSVDPDARFPTMGELLAALARERSPR